MKGERISAPSAAESERRPEKARPSLDRFFLFVGDPYYPSGGWGDFAGSFPTREEASREAGRLVRAGRERGIDAWWHVVDGATGETVE